METIERKLNEVPLDTIFYRVSTAEKRYPVSSEPVQMLNYVAWVVVESTTVVPYRFGRRAGDTKSNKEVVRATKTRANRFDPAKRTRRKITFDLILPRTNKEFLQRQERPISCITS
jgi:hypothetical protein